MFYINTRHFFKIWFSTDPNCFLGMKNQQRLINDRQNNPKATFIFIYSSHCLKKEAIIELNTFCKNHDIQALDFDTDVLKMLSNTQDKFLYHLAKSEISNSLNNTGGNMACASDCTRVIIPILEKCGIYSDFDVEIACSRLPKNLKVKSPLLLTALVDKESALQYRLYPAAINNNILIASYDINNPQKMSSNAKQLIKNIQNKIIERYSNPTATVQTYLGTQELRELVKKYSINHPAADIFSLRKYFEDLRTDEITKELDGKFFLSQIAEFIRPFLPSLIRSMYQHLALPLLHSLFIDFHSLSHDISFIKNQLLYSTVIPVSGPNVYYAMYDKEIVTTQRTMFLNSSLNENNLDQCFLTEKGGDRSWTPQGKLNLQILDREIQKTNVNENTSTMTSATTIIHSTFKRKRPSEVEKLQPWSWAKGKRYKNR